MKDKPNFRVEANRIMGCLKMDEEALRDEIKSSLEEAFDKGFKAGKESK